MITLTNLFRNKGDFFLIAGPCVLESKEIHLEIAMALSDVRKACDIPVIFKASFDKANRNRLSAPRGPGYSEGMLLLEEIKHGTNLPVLTDIHTEAQAGYAGSVCDVLQIPAFLCRQTDLLVAAAKTGTPINVKKGQWCGVSEMKGAVEKIRAISETPEKAVSVTERGTFFGYGDLVVDMRNLRRLQRTCVAPILFDATHSVQRPGCGENGRSGGDRDYIAPLALAAVAAGANGLYIEVHPKPEQAPSDPESMLPLPLLLPLMQQVMRVRRAVTTT